MISRNAMLPDHKMRCRAQIVDYRVDRDAMNAWTDIILLCCQLHFEVD